MSTDGTPSASWPSLRRFYALSTAVAGAVTLAIGAAVNAYLGGDGQAIVLGSIALAVGILVSLAPIFINTPPQSFGIAVVAASGARLLLAMAIVVIATAALDLPRRPIGLGVASALLLSLIVETMLAMAVLSRINRKTELA